MRLEERVAVITGGGGGIGMATALAMARAGAHVVIADIHAAAAESAAARVRQLGRRSLALQVDVRSSAEMDALADRVVAEFGRLDIMFNNAGLAIVKPTLEQSDADWDTVVDTDLKGVFYGCRAAGRVMLRQRRGVILNTASIAGTGGFPRRSPYSAAKAGVINLTRSLACEWALDGIRVNAIAPGYILVDSLRLMEAAGQLDLSHMRRRTPMGQLGTPEDVAAAAVFLASDDARFITGAVLHVDGGYTAYVAPEPNPARGLTDSDA